MSDNNYAFAVSAVRELENSLLSESDYIRLKECTQTKEFLSYLAGKGYIGIENADDIDVFLEKKLSDTFYELKTLAPEPDMLDFLVVENDFHNLKAILKAIVSDKECDNLFKYPCICNPKNVFEVVKSKRFYELPSFLITCAQEAYELITSTFDGQLLDIYIDKCSLECIKDKAYSTNNNFIINYVETLLAVYDIKSALRIAQNGSKNENLLNMLVDCTNIDVGVLRNKCFKSVNDVLMYIDETEFKNISEAYKKSYKELENQCGKTIDAVCDAAKYVSFGVQPLVAYYREVYNEIVNIHGLLYIMPQKSDI